MDPLHLLMLLFAGLAAGYVAGVSGLGGGVIFTPILLFHFRAIGVPGDSLVPLTVGTSLLCTLVAAAASTSHQMKRQAVSRPVAVRVGISAAFGVLIVSRFVTTQPWFDERLFRIVFAAILAIVAVRMAGGSATGATEQPTQTGGRVSGNWLTPTGLAAGGLSAAAGVGGGIVLVPVYRKLLRLPMHVAVGTSSATIVLLTLVGVGSFALSGSGLSGSGLSGSGLPGDAIPGSGLPSAIGYVDVVRAGLLSLPALASTRWGVASAHKLDAVVLQRGFAAIMILLAGVLVYGAVR